MFKRKQYRDPLIDKEVAEEYLTYLNGLKGKFSERFNALMIEQAEKQISENPEILKTNSPFLALEIQETDQMLQIQVNIKAVDVFSKMVQICANGVPISLVLAAVNQNDLQKKLADVVMGKGYEGFYALCDEKRIITPEEVFSKTSAGNSFLKRKAWADIKKLAEYVFQPTAIGLNIINEANRQLIALPNPGSVEYGIDFS